jgi:hypothetical protein
MGRWFSRKKKGDETEIETPDEMAADFDNQWEESRIRALEARRRGTGAFRAQARVDRAGTPKPSRKKKGW